MTTYYIDNSANNASDKNAGTSAGSPFADLAALSKINLQPGDTVAIKAGTVYNVDAAGSAALNLTASGTAGNPITITSYGVGDKPIINNTSTAMYSDAIDLKNSHYVTIDGIAFHNATQAAINVASNSSNITVQNSEMTNVGEGVLLNGTNNLVTQNYIHDLHMVKDTPTNTTSAATIAATNNDDYGANGVVVGASNNEVSFNKIVNAKSQSYDYGTDGGGIELYGTMTNVSIHDNYVTGSEGFLEAGGGSGSVLSNVKIYNNVALNNGNFLDMHNGGGAFAAKFSGVQVYSNTIVDQTNASKEMATIFFDAPGITAAQINVYGNIISLNDGDSVYKQPGTYHSDNLIYLQAKNTHLYNNWVMTLGSGEQYGNPGLTNTAGGIFTPTAAGLAQTAGAVIGAKLQAVISGTTITSNVAVGGALVSPPTIHVAVASMAADVANASDANETVVTTVTKADRSTVVTTQVSGESYAVDQKLYNPVGVLIEDDQYAASGALLSRITYAGGTTTTDRYGPAGILLNENVLHTNGSRDYTNYAVIGLNYTREHLAYNASGVMVEDDQYAASGTLLMKRVIGTAGTTTNHYSTAGALLTENVVHADGSRDYTNYAVTGQNYAREHLVYNVSGALVEDDQYAGSGTLLMKVVAGATGTTTDHYSTAGALLNENIVHADGSRDYTNYAVTGQNYAREHLAYNASGAMVEDDQYAASGTLLMKVVVGATGTTTNHYSTAGALLNENVLHVDGSRDYTNDAVVGQNYSREHLAYNAAGSMVEDDRYTATGALVFKQIVSSSGYTVDTYSASGAHLTDTSVHADGSKDFWNFAGASGSTEHDIYNAGGVRTEIDMTAANGAHTTTALAGGLSLTSNTGVSDVFQSFGNDTFIFAAKSGTDTIKGFHAGNAAGHDTIQINVPGIDSFAQLQAMMTSADHVSTTIHLSATDTILLDHIAPSVLTANDFQFVHHGAMIG